MSNEIALIRFPDGDILYTAYIGSGSSVHLILRHSIEEVKADPLSDPEEEQWFETATEDDDIGDFYKSREERTYPDEQTVNVFTPYAGGMFWEATASRSGMCIVSGFRDDDSTDFEDESQWPKWVSDLGVARIRSLA